MSITIITPPVGEPVDVATTKQHNRITLSDDDALIATYISAARTLTEAKLNRCICKTRLELRLDQFPNYLDIIPLPRGPVITPLIAFNYLDSATQQWTVVDSSLYVVDTVANVSQIGLASNKNWPTALDQMNSVQIQYDSGWSVDGSLVPAAVKVYIMSLVGAMYNNREAVADKAAVTIEFIERLLDPFMEPQL
jgi:uncharacterized phiE125 gp8 family phage protein